MQVHIHPLVTTYLNTLLAWAKCFLAAYGVYPGLYDLLDTPRHDFLAAQLHLRDSTLPRPLHHRSRGPPTLRSEYVALQPHLATPPHPIVCTSVTQPVRPSTCQSVVQPVFPSSRQPPPPPPVCLSHRQSVALSVRPTDSLSILPARPCSAPSVHPPVTLSMTCQSATPPNRNMSKSKGWTLQSSLLTLWMEKTRVNNKTKTDDDVNLLKTL